jgi:hydroxymethylpyrimidine pyrophosphatase-like HAD family hydrolase
MDIILFDVDGTLTPSRGKMDPEFKKEFLNFQKAYKVCFVTGSDDVKTIEQVGEDVFALHIIHSTVLAIKFLNVANYSQLLAGLLQIH